MAFFLSFCPVFFSLFLLPLICKCVFLTRFTSLRLFPCPLPSLLFFLRCSPSFFRFGFGCVWETGSLSIFSSGRHGTHYVTWLASNLQSVFCLCLQGLGLQASLPSLILQVLPTCTSQRCVLCVSSCLQSPLGHGTRTQVPMLAFWALYGPNHLSSLPIGFWTPLLALSGRNLENHGVS